MTVEEARLRVNASPALRMLTTGLVDDAGLFPPEELPFPAALARYRTDQQAGHPVLSGHFVCPSGRLPELGDQLRPDDQVTLSVILSATPSAVADLERHLGGDQRLRLASVEVGALDAAAESGLGTLGGGPAPVVAFVEVGLGADLSGQLDVLARQGWAAKVRCGGVRAELFPAADDLAGFLLAAAERLVPFKATAGLHHAVSYRDPVTGFVHYGFLNLLLAVHQAGQQAPVEDVTGVLLDRDAQGLAARARELSLDQARSVRASLRSYGSCSTAAPVADLERLGLLDGPRPDSRNDAGLMSRKDQLDA